MKTPTATLPTLSADEMFHEAFHGSKNFMTPRILRRGKLDKTRAYELSTGRGIMDETIYGVTIVEQKETGEVKNTNEGQCFHSRAQAENFINSKKGLQS